MSSRGEFLNAGPQSGVYTPKPTPQNAEEIPVYLNDELLDLGGRLNNIMEGGAFPPQTEMPKRVKDGMMIFFTQPVRNSQGVIEINSPGIWLYRRSKWWKLIDDPSSLRTTLQVYKLLPKGSGTPAKPPKDKYLEVDLNGWSYIPKTSTDVTDQWTSVAPFAVTGDNPIVDWSEPIMFNAQGSSGAPGADGYSIEFRYIASTNTPTILDKTAVEPTTNTGEAWNKNIPGTSHPNRNYVWSIYAYVRNNGLRDLWSDPVKYSTPDATISSNAYAVGATTYPSFNPDATGLPGASWYSTVPTNIPSGWGLWRTNRLEWSDGTRQTSWTTPYRANGEVGLKQETRYIAATTQPNILSNTARNPTTTTGEAYTVAFPTVTHPNKSYLWATTATINGLDTVTIPWTTPAKFATPDTTRSVTVYALGGISSYPSFNPNGNPLPGPSWSSTIPTVTSGNFLWSTTRIEWTNGDSQTVWSNPTRVSGADGSNGISVEYRYKASTDQPSIVSSDRVPSGWTLTIPSVVETARYVWVSQASVKYDDTLQTGWSFPVKYATPESTKPTYAYALGTDTTYPVFNPGASGLPGTSWTYDPPIPGKTQRVWETMRYEWDNGTALTAWRPPSLYSGANGADGADGNNGNDGFSLVYVYKNASSKPAEIPDSERAYPPSGWTKTQTTPTIGSVTWVSKNYVRGDVDTATTVTYNYSGVAQLSGSAGQNGQPGTNGANGTNGITYYTWIMYANTSTGGGISSNPSGKKYVGFAYNKLTSTPSLNAVDYAWYYLEGTQGIPGQPGADGVTLYTWLKYADNASGGGMSDSPVGKLYMGIAYNKLDQNESTNPALYQWSLIKGADGTNGLNGAPGINGNDGLDGTPGAGFYRLSMTNFTTWPSQATVDSAFRSEFGRDSEQDDVLTIYDSVNFTRAETRRKDKTGAWVAAELLVHGDMILRGTVVADRIAAGAVTTDKLAANSVTANKIVAGTITGDRLAVSTITGNNIAANVSLSSPSIIGGQLNIGNGVFTVNSAGALTATQATITGNITATSGTFTGTVSGSNISGGTINIGSGKFQVNSAGVMTCTGASIGGTLNGVNGTFAGTLNSVNGTFTGTVSAGSVIGSSISGGDIAIPNRSSAKFYVDTRGNMICNNATINGSLITYGELSGTAIYVPNKSSPKFSVLSDGTTTIQSSSTGSRLVIKNNRIEVWDGAVLRVILGEL